MARKGGDAVKKRTFAIEVELPPLPEDSGVVYTGDFVDHLKSEISKEFAPDPAWILERYIVFSDRQARERRKILQEKLKAMKAFKGSSPRSSSLKEDPLPAHRAFPTTNQNNQEFSKKDPGSDDQPMDTKIPGYNSKKANVATRHGRS
jgi:hypothetical protein